MPDHVIEIVRAIYTNRRFHVSECGVVSELRNQDSGICQGCPLSPFLFVIVMSVLTSDAKRRMSTTARTALEADRLYEILYADDTLLIGVQPELVQEFTAAVEAEGSKYGMILRWGKTQVLSVATGKRLKKPDGPVKKETGVLQYLGSLLAANGRVDSELFSKNRMRNS